MPSHSERLHERDRIGDVYERHALGDHTRAANRAPLSMRSLPAFEGSLGDDAVPSCRCRCQNPGTWEPLGLESLVEIFSPAGFRWWISGGHALELHLGRTWRRHEDTDVGVVRRDLSSVHALLSDWDLHVAAAGCLIPWQGEPLDAILRQNNVWCRLVPDGPWVLDVTIGEGSERNWIYRRDPSVHVSWDLAVLRTAKGVPYLAPHLQLLFKSKGVRPKDDVDAAEVIPELDARRRKHLSRLLEPDHPWQRLLIR